MKRFRKRYAIAALVAFVVATSSYAFANSNTVGASYAGDGTGTVSGYTVTPVWTLNSTDPSTAPVAAITLDQNAQTGNVYARALDSSGAGIGAWVSCAGPTGKTFTCTFPSSLTVASVKQLRVAAAG